MLQDCYGRVREMKLRVLTGADDVVAVELADEGAGVGAGAVVELQVVGVEEETGVGVGVGHDAEVEGPGGVVGEERAVGPGQLAAARGPRA